jgi:hypothetical protein
MRDSTSEPISSTRIELLQLSDHSYSRSFDEFLLTRGSWSLKINRSKTSPGSYFCVLVTVGLDCGKNY